MCGGVTDWGVVLGDHIRIFCLVSKFTPLTRPPAPRPSLATSEHVARKPHMCICPRCYGTIELW